MTMILLGTTVGPYQEKMRLDRSKIFCLLGYFTVDGYKCLL